MLTLKVFYGKWIMNEKMRGNLTGLHRWREGVWREEGRTRRNTHTPPYHIHSSIIYSWVTHLIIIVVVNVVTHITTLLQITIMNLNYVLYCIINLQLVHTDPMDPNVFCYKRIFSCAWEACGNRGVSPFTLCWGKKSRALFMRLVCAVKVFLS